MLLIYFEAYILTLESTHGEGLIVHREADWIISLFLNSLVLLLRMLVLFRVTVLTTRLFASPFKRILLKDIDLSGSSTRRC